MSEVIPVDLAIEKLKEAVVKSYGKKGQEVVNKNYAAIDEGLKNIVKIDVPASWADAVDEEIDMSGHSEFYKKFALPTNRLAEGDDLPVLFSTALKTDTGRQAHMPKKNARGYVRSQLG